MTRILVVDDEPRILALLSGILKTNGYDVTVAEDGLSALEKLEQGTFDIVLSDIRMPEMDGMELYRNLRKMGLETPMVFLTAYGTIESAIEAMRGGAFDYVSKPFKVDELLATLERAAQRSAAISQRASGSPVSQSVEYKFDRLVANSPGMLKICEVIQRVASTAATLLIYGESGTGKEVVARTIHEQSRRKAHRFVAINCAALPEALLESEMFGHVKGAFTGATADKPGLFEVAENGTLFLDEISSMPPPLQGKLLRALQEREIRRVGGTENIPVNARIITATNANLERLVEDGSFRSDLFYRIAVIPVNIPPLRERKEDILPLCLHFIRREAVQESRPEPVIGKEVEAILTSYSWPGNVRELENAIRHAMAFLEGDEITPEVLPGRIVARADDPGAIAANEKDASVDGMGKSLKSFVRQKEREYLERMIASSGGDKEEAAKRLKIGLATLYRKLPPS